MDILMIKTIWGDKVLSGEKSWEIRRTKTKNIKRIALAFSGTGKKYGEVNITECIPLTKELWENNIEKHCVPLSWEELLKRYPKPVAWVLEKPERYPEPIPFERHKGAVIWVKCK